MSKLGISLALALAPLVMLWTGCRSYPETFVESSPEWDRIVLPSSFSNDHDGALQAATEELKSTWQFDFTEDDSGVVESAWRYGFNCYLTGDFRRRVTLKFSDAQAPGELNIRTEAERMKRTPYVLGFGGKPVGWVRGFDPTFQREVHAALSARLSKGDE